MQGASSTNPGDLVDGIYEAAAVPELWPAVLDKLGRIAGSEGAALFTIDHRRVASWIASEAVRPVMDAWVAEGWQSRTQRAPRMMALKRAGFVSDLDVFTAEELDSEPSYVQFLRPWGFGWGAGTGIEMPSGDTAVYSIERRFAAGPLTPSDVARLDEIRPHLARAALLAVRLGLHRARAIADALATIGLPAAVLRHGGPISAANSLLASLIPDTIRDRGSRLTLVDARADALLENALARLSHPENAGEFVCSIPMPACAGRPPIILHLLPVRGAAHDVFGHAAAVLIATPVEPRAVPGAEVLQGLFDLTPAEARIARAIGEGGTVNNIAGRFGVSQATARNQLTRKDRIESAGRTHRPADRAGFLQPVGPRPRLKSA